MKERCAVAAVLFLSILFSLTACSSSEPQEDPTTPSAELTDTPEETPAEEPETELEELVSESVNPLTGLPMDESLVNQRPVAVVINDLKAAMPQLGTSQADIIYEVLVEGGITRMLALYQDPSDVPMIGSIRSARPYYAELALSHDAILLHTGGSAEAYTAISEWGVTALDGTKGYEGTLYWRDPDRVVNNGSVHSVVTTGEVISTLLPTYDIRLEHEDGFQYEMEFAEDGTPEGGLQALTITVPFSGYKTGVFTYDAGSGTYLVSQFGEAQTDGNTNQQLAVTNVLLLKTDCHLIEGSDAGRMSVTLTGSGDGWYANGGQYIPIHWSKDSTESQLVYTNESGDFLVFGAGNTYVCILPLSSNITFE